MKKVLILALVLLLLAGLVVAAFGATAPTQSGESEETIGLIEAEQTETTPEQAQLTGTVVEMNEAFVIIEEAALGQVQVNIGEQTLYTGMEALEVGMTVDVLYNGMMTRSLPPQVFGQEIIAAQEATISEATADEAMDAEVVDLHGTIVELTEEYIVIENAELGQVQVNYGEDTLFEGVDAQTLAAGQHIVVLYNGMMTRSLPPQIVALKVGLYPITGVVTEIAEGQMTIVRGEYGDEVIVFLPEMDDEIEAGDEVIVYTNGAMTMSLPAQTTALSVVVVE